MKPNKDGHFFKNTVEVTFNGTKHRVSQEVADSLKYNENLKKKSKK